MVRRTSAQLSSRGINPRAKREEEETKNERLRDILPAESVRLARIRVHHLVVSVDVLHLHGRRQIFSSAEAVEEVDREETNVAHGAEVRVTLDPVGLVHPVDRFAKEVARDVSGRAVFVSQKRRIGRRREEMGLTPDCTEALR